MREVKLNMKVYDRLMVLLEHRRDQLGIKETPEEFIDHCLHLYMWNMGLQTENKNPEVV